ncbi:MAG: hypothetical protein H6R25_403 [Proteobacteria bacterium]|nr:hypothetical protein [Pseudomonadota bacterium]
MGYRRLVRLYSPVIAVLHVILRLPLRWLIQLTYLCTLTGIHSLAALMQLEGFGV